VLAGVPVILWVLHVFWLDGRLRALSGCDRHILGFWFFMSGAAVMAICEAISILCLVRSRRAWFLIPAVLNLSFLYYVKMALWGPGVGNF